MNAPAAILAVVLAQTAVGSSALLWLAPTWGKVRHGYEILTGATVALMAWGAWAALRGPLAALDPALTPDGQRAAQLLLAMAALTALAAVDSRKSQVVEMRFFGGLSVDETAEVLGVSADTVTRDWKFAKAWLLRELSRQ